MGSFLEGRKVEHKEVAHASVVDGSHGHAVRVLELRGEVGHVAIVPLTDRDTADMSGILSRQEKDQDDILVDADEEARNRVGGGPLLLGTRTGKRNEGIPDLAVDGLRAIGTVNDAIVDCGARSTVVVGIGEGRVVIVDEAGHPVLHNVFWRREHYLLPSTVVSQGHNSLEGLPMMSLLLGRVDLGSKPVSVYESPLRFLV